MIEVLGQSPVNSAVTAGRGKFMSIFRNNVSNAYGEESSRYPRAYTTTRGVLINKEYVEGVQTPDLLKGYQFQFNPQVINDTKETLYEVRGYAGLPYNDYIWAGGGERVISFQLFLDNTPQSKQPHFRPTAYGSKQATTFRTDGVGYASSSQKQGLKGTIENMKREIKEYAVPSKGPSSFTECLQDYGAYSLSRVDERGILPEVEKIQSFLYPAPIGDEKTPLFAEGGVVSTHQFRPPATVILALGPLYLEGVVKSAPVSYTLFDKDLTPIRGTVQIEFAVFEFENLERKINWKPY